MNIEGENNLRIFKIVMMISAAAAFIMLSVLISTKLYPVMNELAASPQKMMELKSWIESYGLWGSMILMAVQVLQVIVSVVPGGPVQILFGMIYGTWKGLLFSLGGMFAGSMIVFFLIRAFKYRFITLFISREKLDEYRFLKDSPKLEKILAALFLIPGVPKDTLVYYAALTELSMKKFIFIAVIMRIPSMLFSTLIGDNLGMGNLEGGLWILAALCIAGIAGMIYHRYFIRISTAKKSFQDAI